MFYYKAFHDILPISAFYKSIRIDNIPDETFTVEPSKAYPPRVH